MPLRSHKRYSMVNFEGLDDNETDTSIRIESSLDIQAMPNRMRSKTHTILNADGFAQVIGLAGAAAVLSVLPACNFVSPSRTTDTAKARPGALRQRSDAVVRFDFGCARPLYEKRIHPRVMIGPDGVKALREKCRSGQSRALLERLRRKVEPMVKGVLASKDLPAFLKTPAGRRIVGGLDNMAMVGVVGEDEKALDAALRVLVNGGVSLGHADVVVAYDLLQPLLSGPDQRRLAEQALKQLRACHQESGEHFLLGAGANVRMHFTLCALMWLMTIDGDPGIPALDVERTDLVRRFEAALYSGLGEGGYPNEDTGYGTLMASRLGLVAIAARRAGLYNAYEQCPRFARFGRAMLHFVQPWGEFLSNTGDHSDDFRAREQVLPSLARYHNDPTLMWLMGTLVHPSLDKKYRDIRYPVLDETVLAPGFQVPTNAMSLMALADAPDPLHPRLADIPTAFVDQDRGIVSLRSGWDSDDTFVFFDGSQRPSGAQGHAHDSGGHFSISSLREYFAVGPGRFGTEQDQHNVLLIDGKSGRSTNGQWGTSPYQGRLIDYRPDPFCDYAAADNTTQANVYWSFRHLGLVKNPAPTGKSRKAGRYAESESTGTPGYVWTVDDVNGANDFREFWWTLLSDPGNKIELAGDHAIIHGWRTGNMLRVHFAIPSPKSYPKPHTLELAQDVPNTSSYKYISRKEMENNAFHTVHHAVYFRPRLIGKMKGYNGRIMAVMVPQKKGAPAPVIESLPTVEGALAMRLTFPLVKDTIIWAYNHQLLEADGIRARGTWLVVRRSRKDGRVIARTTHKADWLEIDGRPYPVSPKPLP
jgi:hypothetical protein